MNNSDQHPFEATATQQSTTAVGVSRRRLMRAGLAAGPVLATLHASPVLATNKKVRPTGSVMASFSEAVLNAKGNKVSCSPDWVRDVECKGPDVWTGSEHKNRCVLKHSEDDDGAKKSRKYHNPEGKCYDDKNKNDTDEAVKRERKTDNFAKFKRCKIPHPKNKDADKYSGEEHYRGKDSSSDDCDSFTVAELCSSKNDDDLSKLARYCVAAYLSAESCSDAADRVWFTRKECCDIWNTLSKSNSCEFPRTKVVWDRSKMLSYMETCFKGGYDIECSNIRS